MRPESVVVLGKTYKITYTDKPSEVDILKHDSLWGQVDFWSRTFRIYDGPRTEADVFESVLHEILHVLIAELRLAKLFNAPEAEDELVGLLALGLGDVLTRNGWLQNEKNPPGSG